VTVIIDQFGNWAIFPQLREISLSLLTSMPVIICVISERLLSSEHFLRVQLCLVLSLMKMKWQLIGLLFYPTALVNSLILSTTSRHNHCLLLSCVKSPTYSPWQLGYY